VFVCAVSLYIVIVANPLESVVPNTLFVFNPVAPLKVVAVKIAAPDEVTFIYRLEATLFPYKSTTCKFIKTAVPIFVYSTVVFALI